MSRAARLLTLVQVLRRHRRPVTASVLAEELGVSLRTLYRDIDALRDQGAPITGAAGLGYVLQPGFFLPPLMFGEDEVDALILGLRLVMARGDAELETAATDALAKIAAMLPPARQDAPATSGLLAGPASGDTAVLGTLRRAIRDERKLRLRYTDKKGAGSERIVWPVAIGFFTGSEVLAAWCELRGDFRHFRLDRIATAAVLDARLPRRRRLLLAEWRSLERDDLG